MVREAKMFNDSKGKAMEGYRLMNKRKKGGNIPPKWIERAKDSRKRLEPELAKALATRDRRRWKLLREWQLAYDKECFYNGIRVVLELERDGKTTR